MLKNIREIGIFMIAAQAVIRFAPGRQYEKYIKSVSGIIILLLFLKPFLQLSGAEWKGPEAVLEKLEEVTDMPDFSALENGVGEEDSDWMGADMDSAVVSRMEAEIKEFLNRELSEDDYRVKQVSIRLEKNPAQGDELCLLQITVRMGRASETEEERAIGIDRIVIGDTENEEETVFLQYRSRFAALLEVEEERVEVRLDGRG